MDFEKLYGMGIVGKMGQELLLEVVFDFSIGLVEDDEDFGDGKGLELFE